MINNSTVEQVTKLINYKGNTIVVGWDTWGQKIVTIEGVSEPSEFWSIKDAKRFINGEEPSCIFDGRNTFNPNPRFKKNQQ